MALSDYYTLLSSELYIHFDKIISIQLLHKDKDGNTDSAWKSFNLDCGEGGPKPGIMFHTDMLQGGIATQFKLSIMNFTPEIDIAVYSHMVITSGYRTSPVRREFTAAIFSAFIESPNPNGKTTFTGVIGDWLVSGLIEENRNIIFRSPEVTIAELLWGIVAGKGPDGSEESPSVKNGGLNLSLNIDLPDWILEDVILVGKEGQEETTYWIESGYACLNWLIDAITVYGEGIVAKLRQQGMNETEAENYRLMITFQDNIVYVFMKGFTKDNDEKIIKYVDLNKVTTVTFQGAALNVIAPWNPLILPGSLFHMQSKYFRGRMSPQQVIDKVARDPADLYRVITMSVDYETNGPANAMRLLAIKNSAFVAQENTVKQFTAIEKAADAKSNVYENNKGNIDIVFGQVRPKEEGERKVTWGITDSTFSESDGVIREIKAGETLGSIASEYFGSLSYYKEPSEGNIDFINQVVPGTYFWPIIAIGNYCMRLKEIAGFETYLDNPTQLIEGNKVFVPTFVSLDDLVSLHDILINMANQFEAFPDNTWSVTQEDIRAIRLICYYMELV